MSNQPIGKGPVAQACKSTRAIPLRRWFWQRAGEPLGQFSLAVASDCADDVVVLGDYVGSRNGQKWNCQENGPSRRQIYHRC